MSDTGRPRASPPRHVACVGDSITQGTVGRVGLHAGGRGGWVERLALALAAAHGRRPSFGFRPLWRRDEWTREGAWTRTRPSDVFDVAPFGAGLYSSARSVDRLVWRKPGYMGVEAFDIVAFGCPAAGTWQYRVDDRPWVAVESPPSPTPGLRTHRVSVAVAEKIVIRGCDGTVPSVAPIAGIVVHAEGHPSDRSVLVHNLGCNAQLLEMFCRPSAGDPLAWFDVARPDVVTLCFSNDVVRNDVEAFANRLRTVLERLRSCAEVLLVCPFEQYPTRRVRGVRLVEGSCQVVASTPVFRALDAGLAAEGDGVAAGTRVAEVESPSCAVLSRPAIGSASDGTIVIVSRDARTQASYRAATAHVGSESGCDVLDLYDEWASAVGAGFDAAYAAGLLHDRSHPSQSGHDDIAVRVARRLGLAS